MSRPATPTLRRSTRIFVGIYVLLFALLPGLSMAMTAPAQMMGHGLLSAVLMSAPTAGYLAGWRWCRFLFRAWLGVLLLLWTLSPLAQHAIDRHAFFWICWTVIEVFLVDLTRRVFTDPRRETDSRDRKRDEPAAEKIP